jgi:hypothetical protein
MKKVILTLMAIMTVLSAAAQNKLNFEAPLFGVTKKNVNPTWSLVAFGEVKGGYSYRFDVPSQIDPNGGFAELNIVDLRYRPGRKGSVISLGLSQSLDVHFVNKANFFGPDGQFMPNPGGWLAGRAIAAERVVSLNFGYVQEFGDWKAGLFISPGAGHGILHNRYRAHYGPYEDMPNYTLVGTLRYRDNIYSHNGWRMGISAGIWYRNIGLTAGWHMRNILEGIQSGNQNVIHAGISIRY